MALAKSPAANYAVNLEPENFRDKVLDVTGGNGVNVVMNVIFQREAHHA